MARFNWNINITGFEDSIMRPQSNANRAQIAVILNKIAEMF